MFSILRSGIITSFSLCHVAHFETIARILSHQTYKARKRTTNLGHLRGSAEESKLSQEKPNKSAVCLGLFRAGRIRTTGLQEATRPAAKSKKAAADDQNVAYRPPSAWVRASGFQTLSGWPVFGFFQHWLVRLRPTFESRAKIYMMSIFSSQQSTKFPAFPVFQLFFTIHKVKKVKLSIPPSQ